VGTVVINSGNTSGKIPCVFRRTDEPVIALDTEENVVDANKIIRMESTQAGAMTYGT